MKAQFTKLVARWRERPAEELDAAALRLVTDAQAAARLRAYQLDENVAALTIERTRDRLDRWGWLFLFAGLAYTTVNVQAFVAGTAAFPDLRWLTAWLVEPMVMGLMLVLLRGEQIANRHGFQAGGWVRNTRWAALAITYVMNTGVSWHNGNPGEVFVHSVPVVLVFMAAEALVQQRLTLTEVVEKLGRTFTTELHRAPSSDVVTASSQRRAPESASVSDQAPVVSKPVAQDVPEVAQPSQDGPSQPEPPAPRQGRGVVKQKLRQAFRELAEEPGAPHPQFIRPVDVDERAGLPRGTAKRRIEELREWWTEEVSRGAAGEATA